MKRIRLRKIERNARNYWFFLFFLETEQEVVFFFIEILDVKLMPKREFFLMFYSANVIFQYSKQKEYFLKSTHDCDKRRDAIDNIL